ncbi:kinase-like domain-containing protein [Gigaspora rosea]|uniref:Kinase-like domain-containing protein n=1 Tax=Gigaspora rosea TaxID=44941 RepID=A0A397TSL8_9GLOM|nr:kinase-like domain-containing protein [Gigaspora rosea]
MEVKKPKVPDVNPSIKDVTISTIKTTAEIMSCYIPVINSIAILFQKIYQVYEDSECNKEICLIMVERVKAAEYALDKMMRRKEENEKYFCKQDYFFAFKRFEINLKNIKDFTIKVSKLKGYRKFFSATNVKFQYENLTKEYDGCMNDLHFAIVLASKEEREAESRKVDQSLKDIEETLEKLEGDIENAANKIENKIEKLENDIGSKMDMVVQEISIIKSQIDKQHSNDITVPKIDAKELINPPFPGENDIRGSHRPLHKKFYKGFEVACKPIEDSKRRQGELTILGKLSLSPNILRFYGLSYIDNREVMVSEWAEHRSLKDLYDNYDIAWPRKLQMIRDICRAILFLREVNIFHHDIRCENVLVTRGLDPKLGNFKYARETNADTTSNLSDQLINVIRWMAPEQIEKYQDLGNTKYKKSEKRYTFNCEIFSFGMLIWELSYEEIPYENLTFKDIPNYVLSGKREKLLYGKFTNPDDDKIQGEFIKIIDSAWQHVPHQRISITKLFEILEGLAATYPIPITLSTPSGLLPDRTVTSKVKDSLMPKFSEEFSINDEDFIDPVKSLEEGIKLHRNRNFEEAWKCFDENAKLGDSLAKYWKGYYLYEGYFVDQNKEQANLLFKEAADNDIPDAQYRYAVSLYPGIKNEIIRREFLHYLKLAADNKHPDAMRNLGDIYVKGKLKVVQNKELGLKYLKLAARENDQQAIEILNKLNEQI